jgi:hypothetical protein
MRQDRVAESHRTLGLSFNHVHWSYVSPTSSNKSICIWPPCLAALYLLMHSIGCLASQDHIAREVSSGVVKKEMSSRDIVLIR